MKRIKIRQSELIPRIARRNGRRALVVEPDGTQYRGEWEDDKRHGQGIERRGDLEYRGFWRRNLRHGIGGIIYHDPERGPRYEYVGHWEDGCRSGYGVEVFRNVYEGNWSHNMHNGWGRVNYGDGSYYEGQWVDDKRHGEGLYIYPNGDTYLGYWKKDQKHGPGIHRFERTGFVLEGIWREDKAVLGTMANDVTREERPLDLTRFPKIRLADPNGLLQERCEEEMEPEEVKDMDLPGLQFTWVNNILSRMPPAHPYSSSFGTRP